MTGGTVGKSILIKTIDEPLLLNQRVGRIRCLRNIIPSYLILFFKSKKFNNLVYKAKNSMNENISLKFLNSLSVPLPPLKEQERIVEKIEHISQYLD